jgi:hypothetical protein
MKKTLHVLALLFITLNLFAQAPQKMSYQAVIRNSANNLLTNAPVKMRISILQGSTTGSTIYSELHSANTNANGLVSIEIGAGTSPTGTFSSINWGDGTYFLKTETDPTNGTNYSIVGTSQLLSVPYALESNNAKNAGNGINKISTTGDTVFLDNGKKYIIPGIKDLNPPSTINNGLVAYYPFNGNANDESGNNNNGVVNGATLTTDRFGGVNKAYSFMNNYIIVPSSNLFNSHDLSVSMWVSSSSTQRQVPLIRLSYSDASNENFGFTLNFNNQNGVEFVAKYNNPNCAPGSGWERNEKIQNILDSNFHHIVGTIIGNTMNLYIDGILANTITTPYSQTSSCWNGDIQIGRNWSNFTDYFIGKLDDIRIYNRALTQEEITYLANN